MSDLPLRLEAEARRCVNAGFSGIMREAAEYITALWGAERQAGSKMAEQTMVEIDMAVAAERERCARIAETYDREGIPLRAVPRAIADDIRSAGWK